MGYTADATIARLINNNNCNYRCKHCNILRQGNFCLIWRHVVTFSCMMVSCIRIVAALLLIVNWKTMLYLCLLHLKSCETPTTTFRVESSWVESHRVAVAVEFELKLWREA